MLNLVIFFHHTIYLTCIPKEKNLFRKNNQKWLLCQSRQGRYLAWHSFSYEKKDYRSFQKALIFQRNKNSPVQICKIWYYLTRLSFSVFLKKHRLIGVFVKKIFLIIAFLARLTSYTTARANTWYIGHNTSSKPSQASTVTNPQQTNNSWNKVALIGGIGALCVATISCSYLFFRQPHEQARPREQEPTPEDLPVVDEPQALIQPAPLPTIQAPEPVPAAQAAPAALEHRELELVLQQIFNTTTIPQTLAPLPTVAPRHIRFWPAAHRHAHATPTRSSDQRPAGQAPRTTRQPFIQQPGTVKIARAAQHLVDQFFTQACNSTPQAPRSLAIIPYHAATPLTPAPLPPLNCAQSVKGLRAQPSIEPIPRPIPTAQPIHIQAVYGTIMSHAITIPIKLSYTPTTAPAIKRTWRRPAAINSKTRLYISRLTRRLFANTRSTSPTEIFPEIAAELHPTRSETLDYEAVKRNRAESEQCSTQSEQKSRSMLETTIELYRDTPDFEKKRAEIELELMAFDEQCAITRFQRQLRHNHFDVSRGVTQVVSE